MVLEVRARLGTGVLLLLQVALIAILDVVAFVVDVLVVGLAGLLVVSKCTFTVVAPFQHF